MDNNNSSGMSAVVAIVAIIAILIIGYFAVQMFNGKAPAPANGINVNVTSPANDSN